jgi:hypothetical protein
LVSVGGESDGTSLGLMLCEVTVRG